jgi:ribosome-associated protein
MTRPAQDVPIRDEAIRLGQLLKLAGVVEDGATARAVLEAGEVTVDGAVDTRRGARVRPGATVRYAGHTLRVTSTPASSSHQEAGS